MFSPDGRQYRLPWRRPATFRPPSPTTSLHTVRHFRSHVLCLSCEEVPMARLFLMMAALLNAFA